MFLKKYIKNKYLDRDRDTESGASLLMALVFISLLGSILVAYYGSSQQDPLTLEAQASAGPMSEFASAARLFARNNSFETPLFQPADCTQPSPGNYDCDSDSTTIECVDIEAGPGITFDCTSDGVDDTFFRASNIATLSDDDRFIEVSDLDAAGLLPPNYAPQNSLGQTINAYIQTFPVNDTNGISTAYVFLEGGTKTNNQPQLMQFLTQSAQDLGVTVTAPIFDTNGNNVSGNCRGSPAVALWDLGCLNNDEARLINGDSDYNFAAGSLIIPAWRAQQHDTRAVMRFPQPQNDSFSTMATNLTLATPVDLSGECADTDQVEIFVLQPDGSFTSQPSGVCRVETDLRCDDANNNGLCDPTETLYNSASDENVANRRFDILNAGLIDVKTLIVGDQASTSGSDIAGDFSLNNGLSDPTDENNEVINIGGNFRSAESVQLTARMSNPNAPDDNYVAAASFGNITTNSNLVITNDVDAAGVNSNLALSQENLSFVNVNSGSVIMDNGGNLVSVDQVDIGGLLTVAAGGEGVVAQNLTTADPEIEVSNQLTIIDSTRIDNLTVSGNNTIDDAFNTVAGALTIEGSLSPPENDDEVTVNITIDSTAVVNGSGESIVGGRTAIAEQCVGDCPNITLEIEDICDIPGQCE